MKHLYQSYFLHFLHSSGRESYQIWKSTLAPKNTTSSQEWCTKGVPSWLHSKMLSPFQQFSCRCRNHQRLCLNSQQMDTSFGQICKRPSMKLGQRVLNWSLEHILKHTYLRVKQRGGLLHSKYWGCPLFLRANQPAAYGCLDIFCSD